MCCGLHNWRNHSALHTTSPLDAEKPLLVFSAGKLMSLHCLAMGANALILHDLPPHRYLSHFRAIHRGAYFAQLRTTTVRKLLPESWGFLCPVHTPDGSPCGLLNHFTAMCQVVARPPDSPEEVQHAIAIVSRPTQAYTSP